MEFLDACIKVVLLKSIYIYIIQNQIIMKTKILFTSLMLTLFIFSCTKESDTLTSEETISETIINEKVTALVSELPKMETNNPELYLKSEFNKKNSKFAKSASQYYDRTDLIYTYFGLSIKGSGGGGAFLDGIDILNEIGDGINIYDFSSVQDDKLYIVAGGIGAPTAIKQNLDALVNSIESSIYTLANIKGKQVAGVLSVESGSVNATLAMLLSKKLNLPLIDADGAGRSVPKLSNLTYAHENYAIAPTVLSSVQQPIAVEVLHPKDADDAETQIRATISQPGFGEIGGLALWAQTGSELKASSVVRNTYSESKTLGLFTLYAMLYNPVYLDLYFALTGKYINSYSGTLTDFNVKTQGGFDVTTLDINTSSNGNITIKALNENLILYDDSNVAITAPHLISYLIEVAPGLYYPLNNGDANIMSSLIGKNIHVVNSYASNRLYDFDNTFLDILHDAFGYTGGVVPPRP